MASTKRDLPIEDDPQSEPEAKKRKVDDGVSPDSSKPEVEKQRVMLNPADCDLDFDIEDNGRKGSALHDHGFAYCWSGARANVGITGGKYCFGCKIISAQPVDIEDTAPNQKHVSRIGISRGDDPVGNLGETEHSFGYGGTGKFSSARRFSDYGEKFGVGDTIICAIDLESKPLASIGFSKNGKWLGTAKHFDAGLMGLGMVDSPIRKLQWESAVFPHVLLKNVVVQLHFSVGEGLVPEEGYKPWSLAYDDGNAMMGPTFSNMWECEIMMMVGLPASGKTTWAEKWVNEHLEKRYVLLGTNLVLDQMKVPGLLRNQNYGERFDRLMGQASAIFDTLLSRAARTPRNYIIDQTNVYKSARKRKLERFANFRKIAVVVFPKPEEVKYRADKRFKEMGKEVPAEAVNNMLDNYVLPVSKDMPGSDEFFDQVMFVELNRGEAQRYLDEMKVALRSTPNSRESSVESYTMPSMRSQVTPAQNWRTSHLAPLPPPPSLNFGYQMPNYVNSVYQGAPSYSEAYQSYQNSSIPRAPAPHGTFVSNGRSFVLGGTIGYSGSYGAPYRVSGPVPFGVSMVEPFPVRSERTSFTENPLGQQFSVTRSSQTDQRAPRPPSYLPTPPPNTYGPPYGTPPPRASYGNFPAVMQHPGGYAPSQPRSY